MKTFFLFLVILIILLPGYVSHNGQDDSITKPPTGKHLPAIVAELSDSDAPTVIRSPLVVLASCFSNDGPAPISYGTVYYRQRDGLPLFNRYCQHPPVLRI